MGSSISTYAKFSEKCTCTYQRVRNISFSGNVAYVLNKDYLTKRKHLLGKSVSVIKSSKIIFSE